jgi:hypothetical protein
MRVRGSHGAPQSKEEIRPIIESIQTIDRLLDIIWNPQAVLLEKGRYSEIGKLIPPIYDGRWQVIRHQTENFHPERGDYAVICTLTTPERHDGILCLTHDGPYAPVGEWVIELMRSADAQNVRQFEAIRNKLWRQHDLMEEREADINEAEAREGLDRVHFDANYAGGVGNWQGKGADFADSPKKAGSLIVQP